LLCYTLVEGIGADSAEWVQTVRRVMARTRWQKSTPVLIGLAVLVFVAAVVAAAVFFTTTGHGANSAHAPIPPPHAPAVKPGVTPVSDTAE
jgi:D-alanyl-D-alanine carboxypeptidase/D-alanyl-D-alanine-endopeptidase (penicillin-binding protein 4)